MNAFLSVLLLLYTINYTLSSKVQWLPTASFSLPQNFRSGKVPCSKQTVILPDSVGNAIEIDSDVSMSEFVLGSDCDLVFRNAEIAFGPIDDANCTDDGNTYYFQKSLSSWAQPGAWSSPRFNEATPDAERVPCFDDIVELPADSTFSIRMPEETQVVREIKIGDIRIKSENDINYDYLYDMTDGEQQLILNSNYDSGIEIRIKNCMSLSGCPCQDTPLKIECENKFCEKPACVNPIEPIGHCCKICGGTITFGIDQSFDLIAFTELVDSVVTSYGKDNLAYHIGRLPSNLVQVVVVDKGKYVGVSSQVVNAINQRMEKRFNHEMLMSGSPLDEANAGGNIFISVFFIVVMVMTCIYLYYYKLPEVRFPFNRAGILRFQNRSESVVSLTRRDSGVGVSGGPARASFRNPLYDSKRERVIVEESALED